MNTDIMWVGNTSYQLWLCGSSRHSQTPYSRHDTGAGYSHAYQNDMLTVCLSSPTLICGRVHCVQLPHLQSHKSILNTSRLTIDGHFIIYANIRLNRESGGQLLQQIPQSYVPYGPRSAYSGGKRDGRWKAIPKTAPQYQEWYSTSPLPECTFYQSMLMWLVCAISLYEYLSMTAPWVDTRVRVSNTQTIVYDHVYMYTCAKSIRVRGYFIQQACRFDFTQRNPIIYTASCMYIHANMHIDANIHRDTYILYVYVYWFHSSLALPPSFSKKNHIGTRRPELCPSKQRMSLFLPSSNAQKRVNSAYTIKTQHGKCVAHVLFPYECMYANLCVYVYTYIY